MTDGDRPAPVGALDWSAEDARAFGNDVLDIWTELLERLDGDLPVVRSRSAAEVREATALEIPAGPMPIDDLVEHLRTIVFDESMYPGHPGFLAYISGTGTVPGAAADLIAAGLNQNAGGWRLSPAATEVEQHLMRWFARRFGMPEGSMGYVVSGGAMSNLIGLTLARTRHAGWDVRDEGMLAGPQLTVYASTEVHDTIDRAAQMLGIGMAGVRHVVTDDRLRMDVEALRAALEADLAAGHRPIAVVGAAGTTGTGAVDPLLDIAEICEEYGIWFHVDAAYGGAAALTEPLRPLFEGIDRADSLGFDPHKWLYTPHAGACLLVRDPDVLVEAFAVDASYIVTDRDQTGWGIDVYELSPQFSRPFAALKIWVSLLAHGWDAYEERINHDVELARYLHRVVTLHPELEPIGEPGLSITCFRYVPPDLQGHDTTGEYLDRLNERLMFRLQLGGNVFPSNAVINGQFALRSCIVNFRTEADTMDELASETVRLGRTLDAELRPEHLR
ncbi:MAG: pyridoxal-dependent decarboxylase [Acidimicrobiia bacterium]|nr:pyridoxal-dependent decarboxylase [Acidimicrobiia bacterium]